MLGSQFSYTNTTPLNTVNNLEAFPLTTAILGILSGIDTLSERLPSASIIEPQRGSLQTGVWKTAYNIQKFKPNLTNLWRKLSTTVQKKKVPTFLSTFYKYSMNTILEFFSGQLEVFKMFQHQSSDISRCWWLMFLTLGSKNLRNFTRHFTNPIPKKLGHNAIIYKSHKLIFYSQ